MKKALVLTSRTAGGGHWSPAQAIKSALAKDFQVEIYDALPTFATQAYFYIHHYLPAVFNFFYRLTNNPMGAKILHEISFFFTKKALQKIPFRRYDLIISTQYFLTSEVRRLTKKPLVVFILDLANLHQVWLCSEADLTLVATRKAAEICQEKGLPANKVKVVGFPIRPEFWRQKGKPTSKQFTVFLGGSGYGLRETKIIIKHLREVTPARWPSLARTPRRWDEAGIKLIVVCGRHGRLYHHLKKQPGLEVYGFTENMAELMAQADLIVGKAGPNLLLESVALKIPFLAVGYSPEQEKGNLELIKKQKIGFVEPNPKKAAQLILSLAQNPSRLDRLQPNIRRLANHHHPALKNILREINQILR